MRQFNLLAKGVLLFANLFCVTEIFAQKIVTGRILNANDKQPVADATIQIKGGTTKSI